MSLRRHLQFKPHGDNLLTQSGEFWLASVRVLVFAIALVECVSWGYLGMLFIEGSARWISGAFVGGIIFVVVFMIDLSLVTLDRAWSEHAETLLGQSAEATSKRRFRDAFTFVFRVLLVLGSLYITAPFLASIVFRNDLAQFTASEATQAIEASRKSLADGFDRQITEKNAEIFRKREQYQAETAGKGLSGRYGEGPAAKAMLQDALRLEHERDTLVKQKDEALSAYNRLAQDWSNHRDELAASYNVQLPRASIAQNRKALDELRKRPETQQTEVAIKAFLMFIFGGLLLLKLFEPSSIRLYLSEVLQEEYVRYRAGVFDLALPENERSTNPKFRMTAQRLYSFLKGTWRDIQTAEAVSADELRRRKTEEAARRQAERDREEQRAQWEFEEEKQKRAEERRAEEENRRRLGEIEKKKQELRDRAEASRQRMEKAKGALQQLCARRTDVQRDVSAAGEALRKYRDEVDAAESSFNELMLTQRVVEEDIHQIDLELAKYDQRKTPDLDPQARAEISATQSELRQKRIDAVQGLNRLREAEHGEKRKVDRAHADLQEGEMHYQRMVQRLDALLEKITLLESQIAEEALRSGSAILNSGESPAIPGGDTAP